jgi:ferredoxin--NADP+ reductase
VAGRDSAGHDGGGVHARRSANNRETSLMAAYDTQKVLTVHHWNESLFTFTCTRGASLRFESGHFVMVGLMVDGKPLMRAYSIASAHWEEHLEFFSIKVQDGPLTSRLQHLKVGDDVLVGRKPTGTLVLTDLLPGRYLYLFATGTGLAPFMSIIRDPDTYERFEKIVLVHGTRKVDELAYADLISHELPRHDHLGEQVRAQLVYYPTVTREPFRNQGRLPELIANGKLCSDIGFPQIDPKTDRAMICGGPAMLKDMRAVLDQAGFTISAGIGQAGDYVIERAFVEK